MSAKELLSLPPAEWERVAETMSWRELREVAEKMRRVAVRAERLESFATRKAALHQLEAE